MKLEVAARASPMNVLARTSLTALRASGVRPNTRVRTTLLSSVRPHPANSVAARANSPFDC
jgi:hypothetical protein